MLLLGSMMPLRAAQGQHAHRHQVCFFDFDLDFDHPVFFPPFCCCPAGKGSIFAIFQALWPFHRDGMRITIKFADGKGGRKLMQIGQSGANMYTETLALDSTEQAILNAVNSDSASATAGAAAAGEGNALLSTTYPINPTYADGIDKLATYGTGGN